MPTTARESDVPPGPPTRTIGPYEVLTVIGRGTSGVVLLARRPGIERLLALKLLPPDLDAEGLARVDREARVASRLDHPGLVRVTDCGVHQGQAFIVMDHVPGPTLKERLAEVGRLPSAEAAALVASLAEAVHVAHQAGVVHRDLKPANVIIDGRDGRAKVTDFGLARDLRSQTKLTQQGALLGTPYYMAPEQLRGAEVDARADVYALGVILYELLCGKRPFEAPNVTELARRVMQGGIDPPSTRVPVIDVERPASAQRSSPPRPAARYIPPIDPRVEAVALAALALDPADRPATAAALAAQLREAARPAPRARADGPRPESARGRGGALEGALPLGLVCLVGALASAALGAWGWREREAGLAEARDLEVRRAQKGALEAAQAEVQLELERARAASHGPADEALAELAARVAARRGELDAALREEGLEADAAAELDGTIGTALDAVIARLQAVPGATRLRVDLLRNRGRVDEAAALAERAIAGGDADPDLLVAMARIELARRQPALATRWCERIVAEAPPDAPAALFARAALRPGDVPEALRLVRQAIERAPDKVWLRTFLARVLLAQGTRSGQRDTVREALAAAEDAVRCDPSCPEAWALRYGATLELCMDDRAQQELLGPKVLVDLWMTRELHPDPSVWIDAGIVHLMLGRARSGLAELDQAVRRGRLDPRGLDPDDALRCEATRGDAFALLGDLPAAAKAWRDGRIEGEGDAAIHLRILSRLGPAERRASLEAMPEAARPRFEALLR